jgi:hypothetical protein
MSVLACISSKGVSQHMSLGNAPREQLKTLDAVAYYLIHVHYVDKFQKHILHCRPGMPRNYDSLWTIMGQGISAEPAHERIPVIQGVSPWQLPVRPLARPSSSQ